MRPPVASAIEATFTGQAYSTWGYSGNWSTGLVPTTGDIADLFAGQQVNYDIAAASAVPLQAVQVAGGTANSPAVIYFESGTALDISSGFFVGGANTGTIPGSANSSGPGQIQQTNGQVNLSTGSLLAVDSSSTYQLGGSAQLIGCNEQLAGLFSQNGVSSNTLSSGSVLSNTGIYNLQGSGQSLPTLSVDTINNTGTFNQSASSVLGTTTGYASFNNSGTYLYSSGTFAGTITNNIGATACLTGSIPFSQGIVNNGLLTVTGATGTYAGTISGTGSLNFNGSQSVTLAASNSFNGSTGVNGGVLTLASPAGEALSGPVIVSSAGSLSFGADAQLSPAALLTVNGGSVNLVSHNESIGSLVLNSGQFLLSGTGYLSAGSETTAGTFIQSNSSSNVLIPAASLANSGTYLLQNTATLSADTILNAGVFNQSGGTVQGSTASNSAYNNSNLYLFSGGSFTGAVSNNGTFNSSGGNFNGSVTNNIGGLYVFSAGSFAGSVTNFANYNLTGGTSTGSVNNSTGATIFYSGGTVSGSLLNNPNALFTITNGSTGASIPFTQGIVNNGQITLTGVNGSYPGPISGSGSLIFNGSQQVTLTGSGSFNGSTSITSGTLSLAALLGPALQGNVTVGAAATLTFGADSQLGSNTLLTVNGGTVNLQSHNESIGSLAMTAGQINQPGGLPLDVMSGLVSIGKGSATIADGLRTNANFTFTLANNSSLSVGGPLTGSTTSTSTGLVLSGTGGILSIYGNSLLSTIDIKQGILQLAEGGSLGGINTSTTIEAAGSLSLYGQLFTVGDLLGSGAVALGSGSLYVDSSTTGSTFSGTINGTGSLTKFGLGTLTLAGTDSASGSTTINGGTFTVTAAGAIGNTYITSAVGTIVNLSGAINNNPLISANGTVNINASTGSGIFIRSLGGLSIGSDSAAGDGQVNIGLAGSHSNRTLLVTSSLVLTGNSNSWSSQLDLSNNDMVVIGGNLAAITNQVRGGYNAAGGGNWKGNGITSSSAGGDTTHLTALGVIQNNNGSSQPIYGSTTPMGTFDGYSPQVADVLIKYTYVGDANLDGKVDGSDYSLIDNGFASQLTGWYNGDFNYDGVIDGSDYALIDNAFNSQGTSLAGIVAGADNAFPTAQIAEPTAVPEPVTLGLLGLLPLLLQRKRRSAAAKSA